MVVVGLPDEHHPTFSPEMLMHHQHPLIVCHVLELIAAEIEQQNVLLHRPKA